TRFGREKRAFDMPSGDGMVQLFVFGAQSAESFQPLNQRRPFMGDLRQEKPPTTRLAQGPRCNQRMLDRQIVALKIDAAKAVDLKVNRSRSQQGLAIGWNAGRLELRDGSVAPAEADALSGRVMPCPDFAVAHAPIWSTSSIELQAFCGRKAL